MERLQELITQLKDQFERQGDLSQMLQITRSLEAELTRLSGQAMLNQHGANLAQANRGSAKVAVMMPSSMKMYAGQQAASDIHLPAAERQVAGERSEGKAEIKNLNELRAASERSTAEFAPQPKNPVRPVAALKDKDAPAKETGRTGTGSYPFDPLSDIPTLAQQQVPRELNDVIAGNNGFNSRNDSLKVNIIELSAALNEAPVRDLKKAIGVNDRYIFISQLFRGDEVMYERSIKTINGFRILPEAEYWMERELKVKLGWDENREATRHFYQLVKRRFA